MTEKEQTVIEELQADFDVAASMIPGKKKLSLHAIYLDNKGECVPRDQIKPEHYDVWIKWAKEKGYGLNLDAVKEISEKGVKLIITVDNGISAFNEE